MKRVWNIVMVGLVLLIGAKPSVAMHYCGSDFTKLSLTDKQTPECCDSHQGGDSKGYYSGETCCSLETIELEVDDFSSISKNIRQKIYPTDNAISKIIWVANSNSLTNLKEQIPVAVERRYPSRGLHLCKVSIHSLNCLFLN